MSWQKITIKTPTEIAIMREGGKILAEIMQALVERAVIGASAKEIDKVAEDLVFKYKVEPAFKDYEGYPAVSCVSVNNVVVHALPSEYVFKQGDVVSLDIGIKHKGFFTDMAVTVAIGQINPEANRLIKTAKKALRLAIAKIRPGNTFGDIGNTIQRFVEYQGFGVVRELCGHGIGQHLHEEPKIPNYGQRHKGLVMEEGMVFCVEPMITMGDWHLKKSADGFGYETQDGSLSCHFEHTIALTSQGPEILTKI
jgi:methionyl aminopeptidase